VKLLVRQLCQLFAAPLAPECCMTYWLFSGEAVGAAALPAVCCSFAPGV